VKFCGSPQDLCIGKETLSGLGRLKPADIWSQCSGDPRRSSSELGQTQWLQKIKVPHSIRARRVGYKRFQELCGWGIPRGTLSTSDFGRRTSGCGCRGTIIKVALHELSRMSWLSPKSGALKPYNWGNPRGPPILLAPTFTRSTL
jgi:hypothetical protein